jgi:hypothetical protein
MKLQELFEALKPSQYRPLVKGWDKKRYADIFNGEYRIYIPLDGNASDDIIPAKPNPKVEQEVNSAGYEIEDYRSGIASKDNGKRKIKIGKILKDPETIKLFNQDPVRANAKTKEQIVVISRHPYDIAGMSTDRGWTSCMNLVTKPGYINNSHFIPLDIKEGTLVAYLINTDDKNINSPSARMLIKPFVNVEDGTNEPKDSEDPEVAFGIEDVIYGTGTGRFKKTVVEWVNHINSTNKLHGVFKLSPGLYADVLASKPKFNFKSHGYDQELKDTLSDFEANKNWIIDNPEAKEKDLILAISYYPSNIRWVKNMSEKIQKIAVHENGLSIQYIIAAGITPSEDVQLTAIESIPTAIKFIDKPSEVVQMAAIKGNINTFELIKKPLAKVQLYVVRENGNFIRNLIFNGVVPSEAVQLAAVKQTIDAIKYIKSPSEKVLKYVNDYYMEHFGTKYKHK